MNKRHYEHTLPNIRGSLSNTYFYSQFLQCPAGIIAMYAVSHGGEAAPVETVRVNDEFLF